MNILSPSLLSVDFNNMGENLKIISDAGAEYVHVDVMDGMFVPNISFGPPVIKHIRKATDKILDVHLMIENPKKYVEPFAAAGADILTFHYEAVEPENIVELIKYIKSFDIMAGMSIKPKTTVDVTFPFLSYLDMILIMTVEPGFGGQKFMPDCAEKIKPIRELNRDIIVQVDGGINAETGKICRDYGANSLVAGSYIYSSDNIPDAIASLRI